MNSTIEMVSSSQAKLSVQMLLGSEVDNASPDGRPAAEYGPGARGERTLLPFRLCGSDRASLSPAVDAAISTGIAEALREHKVRVRNFAEVEIVELDEPVFLRFVATVDIAPEYALPDLSAIVVEVDPVTLHDDEVDEHIERARARFAILDEVPRPAEAGDLVRMSLVATVNGADVERGQADDVLHEVGSGHLLPGLDEAVVGMVSGASKTIKTQLVGGDLAGQEADLAVTVTSVSAERLPPLDDRFALAAAGVDTVEALRDEVATRLTRAKRFGQLHAARDLALQEIARIWGMATPVEKLDEALANRKRDLADQLSEGVSLADYFSSVGTTEARADAEFLAWAQNRLVAESVLDGLVNAMDIKVTEREFATHVIQQASSMRLDAEDVIERLMESDTVAPTYTNLRRAKALARVLQSVVVKDTSGEVMNLDDLRPHTPETGCSHDGAEQPH
ncbi:trigger factor [Catellatospora methionotrophica]|uniref:trigger factor n=1 Tax=Catellatospora methionotrophica TaxID=121620 RepID=UPI0033FF718B